MITPGQIRLNLPLHSLYQFFPQASQIVVAQETAPGFQAFQVSLAHCREAGSAAMVCDDVIMQTAKLSKCFLLADQWCNQPGEKPRLSAMGRVSVMSVPIQTGQGNRYAVLQMISGDPGPEFDMGDLERWLSSPNCWRWLCLCQLRDNGGLDMRIMRLADTLPLCGIREIYG